MMNGQRIAKLITICAMGALFACSDDSKPATSDSGTSRDQSVMRQDSSQPQQDSSQGTVDVLPPNYMACKGSCTKLEDCPQGAVACEGGRCLQCKTASDCPQYAPKCNAQGICYQCNHDTDCSAIGAPTKCDQKVGWCYPCETNEHCSYLGNQIYTGKCDPTYHECVGCGSDADCQVRDADTNELWSAVHCVNNVCLECRDDNDCVGKSRTGCFQGFCQDCRKDSECCPPNTPNCGLTCSAGLCGCTTAQQCSDANGGVGSWTCESPAAP
jgi:hypothetical protein